MAKCNLEAQTLRMNRQSQEKFLPGKVGDTLKVQQMRLTKYIRSDH